MLFEELQVVCFYMQKMEHLHDCWELSNDKNEE